MYLSTETLTRSTNEVIGVAVSRLKVVLNDSDLLGSLVESIKISENEKEKFLADMIARESQLKEEVAALQEELESLQGVDISSDDAIPDDVTPKAPNSCFMLLSSAHPLNSSHHQAF